MADEIGLGQHQPQRGPIPAHEDPARILRYLTGPKASDRVRFLSVPPLRRILPLLVAGLSLLPASRAAAQLVDSSPFMAPGAAASAPGTVDSGALELRGIMSTPDGTRYCIYDPAKKSGTWVGVNERGNAFVVRQADPQHQAVVVQADGRTVRLVLRTSKVAALNTAAGPGGLNGTSGPGGLAERPSPAEEAARLQAVAEAVRARRQMREQAAQGNSGVAPAAPAADGGDASASGRRNRRQQQ